MGRESSPADLDAYLLEGPKFESRAAHLAGSEGVTGQAYRRENLAFHLRFQRTWELTQPLDLQILILRSKK